MRKTKSKTDPNIENKADPNIHNKAAPEAELPSLRAALEPLVAPNPAIPLTVAQANVAAANPGIFSLANIRVDQNFAVTPGLVDLPLKPSVRKPGKQEFFMVHPDPAYTLPVALLLDESEDKMPYLLVGGIHNQLPGEYRLVNLHLAVTTQGTSLIIPATIPGWNNEAPNSWHLSLANAIEMAKKGWTRIRAVKSAGGYQITIADGALAAVAPKWPREPLIKLIELGFADKVIADLQHPLLQRLSGHA
jgi:hypothetical protein